VKEYAKEKLWLLVSPDDRLKLETKLAQVLKIPKIPYSDFVRDNGVFIAPEQYKKWNIRYTLELQGSGDMIITYPEAYHQVLNLTDTLAEAINYAPKGWKLNSDYQFKDRSVNPTALSAEDFNTAEEGRKAVFCLGTKRGPTERLAVDDIRTPLEKRSKNLKTQLLTPLSTTGPRQQPTERRTQSSSPRSIGNLTRRATLIEDREDDNTEINSECDDNSSNDEGSSFDVDEGIANSSFPNESQFSETSEAYTQSPNNNAEAGLSSEIMNEDDPSVEGAVAVAERVEVVEGGFLVVVGGGLLVAVLLLLVCATVVGRFLETNLVLLVIFRRK